MPATRIPRIIPPLAAIGSGPPTELRYEPVPPDLDALARVAPSLIPVPPRQRTARMPVPCVDRPMPDGEPETQAGDLAPRLLPLARQASSSIRLKALAAGARSSMRMPAQGEAPFRSRLPHFTAFVQSGLLRGAPHPVFLKGYVKVEVDPAFAETGGNRIAMCTQRAHRWLVDPRFLDKVATIRCGGRRLATHDLQDDFSENGGLQHAHDLVRNLTRGDDANRRQVASPALGHYLADTATAMLAQGRDKARIFLSTTDHMMALKIDLESDANGDWLSAKAYDPNAASRETIVDLKMAEGHGADIAIEAMRRYASEDFFELLAAYFPQGFGPHARVFTAISLDDVHPGPGSALAYLGEAMTSTTDDAAHGQAVALSLENNTPRVITALSETWERERIAPDRLMDILATPRNDLLPPRTTAAQQGFLEPLRAAVDILRRWGIVGAPAAAFVQGSAPSGWSDLFSATANRRGGKHVEFIEYAIDSLNITSAQADALFERLPSESYSPMALAAIFDDGTLAPALAAAWQRRGRPVADIVARLECRDSSMVPAIHGAARIGRTAPLDGLADALRLLGYVGEPALRILDGRSLAGMSAWRLAAKGCHSDFSAALVRHALALGVPLPVVLEMVDEVDDAGENVMHDLARTSEGGLFLTSHAVTLDRLGRSGASAVPHLEAVRYDGTPALFTAAEHDNPTYPLGLGHLIIDLALDTVDTLRLLTARRADGTTAAMHAAAAGHTAFLEALFYTASYCDLTADEMESMRR